MKNQTTNNLFASPETQADSSACKTVISLFSFSAKNKRTAPIMKQPFHLTNFSPLGAITPWTWRKCVRIIIKSDYFSAFYAFVAPLSGFFTCSVHKKRFNKLKTCSTLIIERLLTPLLSRTNFYFFCNCCGWSSSSLSCWDKLSCSSISNSCRCFTHHFLNFNYKTDITNYLTEHN